MFNKILVVCVGNICRSPIGERLLQKHLPQLKVNSAGIKALVGRPADPNSISVAAEENIDLSLHIAQQLTAELIAEHDLILVMERGHINAVTKLAPAARGKTMLFGQWNGQQEISDPYRQSREAFEFVTAIMSESALKWAEKLNKA
ncbi:protein tyrosine phosphatase [Psychromonas sp. MB-3u-54]|uniref:arsenate reductase/protein-tyrosine-phosphatase family protein n=1 Tax=Psychromonas sp. MB-3u-54 TaxID=2058319 RepID=UPI000C349CBB|nr:protein tyrosine phosphatase [Psychromonas sp. MB-3u-54]PKH01842.1 protein tyrosine phosphatase [Psychromonas sp. MB-3u-54]